jgi:hypothetical protein
MAYIEPCCCDRQLPQLLRQQRGATLFQTNGDVTAKHLLKAVCCMVEYGNELWLAADTIDLPLLRLLRHWHDRNWIDHLWLITRENQTDTVTAELSATYGDHLHYAYRDTLATQLFCYLGPKHALVVQGEMLLTPSTTPRLLTYSAIFGQRDRLCTDGGDVKNLLDNLRPLFKIAERKAARRQQAKKKTTKQETKVSELQEPAEGTDQEPTEKENPTEETKE